MKSLKVFKRVSDCTGNKTKNSKYVTYKSKDNIFE